MINKANDSKQDDSLQTTEYETRNHPTLTSTNELAGRKLVKPEIPLNPPAGDWKAAYEKIIEL